MVYLWEETPHSVCLANSGKDQMVYGDPVSCSAEDRRKYGH